MRLAPRVLLALTATSLVLPRAAGGQGALPWQPGDAPPAVAGLHLGDLRAASDSLLGKPDETRTVGPGLELLVYRTRGIALLYPDTDSLAATYLISPAAGDLGGVRVGDAKDSVVERWGEPTAGDAYASAYEVGDWMILVQIDSTSDRVAILALGAAEEAGGEAEGPYDADANAAEDIAEALRASQSDGKLVLLGFGANWCLDCHVLDRLFQDSTVAPFLEANFRVVRIDVGEFDRNLDISSAYDDPIRGGVPAAVVLSPSGDVVATTKGGVIESARNMTPDELLQLLQSWVAAAHR